jgi:uncharacterized protein YdiU (UPF0061 family)
MVYAGHQFGGYSARLGDGRGLLLGEAQGPNGSWDLHLKGAGPTPYSRFADGRAVLRSTIREYLAGEALSHLGIASTRSLCMIGSNEAVMRETVETGAMMVRLAKTHVRFGSFEYFHYQQDYEAVKTLADYVIEQHVSLSNAQSPYEDLLEMAIRNTAQTIAKWQSVGFAHGVLNTDNMSIIGDTFDFGPYGFLDEYDPEFICNHSDSEGRYSFERQPGIGLWNLNALAHSLSSLIDEASIRRLLSQYEPILVETYADEMRQKLGLERHREEDQTLLSQFLHMMRKSKADYTNTFRSLGEFSCKQNTNSLSLHFQGNEQYQDWETQYRLRLSFEKRDDEARQKAIKLKNPKFILRSHLAHQAIEKATKEKDFSEIDTLLMLLQSPFDEHEAHTENYAQAAPAWSKHLSISCSS